MVGPGGGVIACEGSSGVSENRLMDEAVQQHKDQADKNELLLWAAARGLLPDAAELVKGVANVRTSDKQGRTPAHYAAAHGHMELLEFLSTRGADLDAEDLTGRTPLQYAALGSHPSVVQFLLSKSVWVDTADGADDTPLHMAARGLASMDAKAIEATEQAAGHDRKMCATVQSLLAAGAKPGLRNKAGLTALGEAVAGGHAAVVNLLLTYEGQITDTVQGFTLLHLAAGLGHTECLAQLLQCLKQLQQLGEPGERPDSNSADNPEHLTPLHAAALVGSVECVDLLLKHGGNAKLKDALGRLPYELVPPGGADSNGPQGQELHVADMQALSDKLRKTAGIKGKAPPRPRIGPANPKLTPATPFPQPSAPTQVAGHKQDAQGVPKQGTAPGQAPAPPAGEGGGKSLSQLEQFRALPLSEQLRKVDGYLRMEDGELRLLTFPPPNALPALQTARKAVAVHTCWEAVAAIRQDASFQEDASDKSVQKAIEDLRNPLANPQKYAADRQVQSVFAKLNKLHAILRQQGQAFKVSVEDLKATPSGPNSIPQTLLQLSRLADKAKEAKAAAVMAIIGRSPPPKATAEGRGKDSKEGLAKSESHSELPPGPGMGRPLQAVPEDQELHVSDRDWWGWLRGALWRCGWHLGRLLMCASVMMAVMWIMGLMPDQIDERQALQRQLTEQSAAAAAASAAEGPGAAAAAAALRITQAVVEGGLLGLGAQGQAVGQQKDGGLEGLGWEEAAGVGQEL